MDMSFSLDQAKPLAAPPLGYAALVAAIRADGRHANAEPSLAPDDLDTGPCPVSTNQYLAAILLGRSDCRTAALALGGCFAPALRTRAARPFSGTM